MDENAKPSAAFEDWASEEGINNFHFHHCWAAWQAALASVSAPSDAAVSDERAAFERALTSYALDEWESTDPEVIRKSRAHVMSLYDARPAVEAAQPTTDLAAVAVAMYGEKACVSEQKTIPSFLSPTSADYADLKADGLAQTEPVGEASEEIPVEAWHGERKVTIYSDCVIRVWGSNIETEMSDEPRTLQSVQDAMEWLFATTPASREALTDEQIEDIQEAREIIENMVRSVELDGNYSSEATCTFLRQALQCLPLATAAQPEGES
jgi:hypothetical protein